MLSEKGFYRIKMDESFLTSEAVDYLMSQKEGANYVVLYEMLYLKALNENGLSARRNGEVVVQFDVEKIQRECKYFSIDTIMVALELYKKLGMACIDDVKK